MIVQERTGILLTNHMRAVSAFQMRRLQTRCEAPGAKRLKLKYDKQTGFRFASNLLSISTCGATARPPSASRAPCARQTQELVRTGHKLAARADPARIATSARRAAAAGAYTRPRFSSDSAVSDTKCTQITPKHPITPANIS